MSSRLILERELQGKYIQYSYFIYRYGIAPRLTGNHGQEQPRIEVLNPCDDGDDQKTPTTILFSNEGEFLGKFTISFILFGFSFWKGCTLTIRRNAGRRRNRTSFSNCKLFNVGSSKNLKYSTKCICFIWTRTRRVSMVESQTLCLLFPNLSGLFPIKLSRNLLNKLERFRRTESDGSLLYQLYGLRTRSNS